MLVILDEAHYQAVLDFADRVQARDRLQRQLDILDGMGGTAETTRCTLHPDFAAHSFIFVVELSDGAGGWRRWLTGGLIYSGPAQPLDGSGPAFTVGFGPVPGRIHDWSLHT